MAPWLLSIEQTAVLWDRSSFLWMNLHLQCKLLDWTMPAVTELGLGQVQALALLLLAVYLGWRAGEVRRPGAVRSAVTAIRRRSWWVGPLLICLILSSDSDIVKAQIPRLRPWWFYLQEHKEGRFLDVNVRTVPGIDPLRVRGFPSGHTTSSVAIAMVVTMLVWRRPRGRLVAASIWGLALLIAFSRIYLASHWPLDVLGGAVLGVVTGIVSLALARAWARLHAPRDTVAVGGMPADTQP